MSFEREEAVRARKAHTCERIWPEVCSGQIQPGELYLYCAGFMGESSHFQVAHICEACAGHNFREPGQNLRWLCLVERKYPTLATPEVLAERRGRCMQANRFIEAVSQCGRQFFRHGEEVSYLAVAGSGTVFVWDAETQRSTDTRWPDRWRDFSEGGTLQRLVQDLAHFITTGEQMNPRSFGIQPDWYDVWGYGQSMATVQAAAVEQGIVAALVPV